jgi:GT2 family glycosyltransferase
MGIDSPRAEIPIRIAPPSSYNAAMPPLVHIVTLNWQNWPVTFELLRALRDLRYGAFKTVVVDNGSTDDSVKRLRESYPEVEVVEAGRNLGFGGGNNVAIRRALDAGADYIWLINNDAKPAADALEALVATAEKSPRSGAAGSVILSESPPGQVEAWGGGDVVRWMGYARLSRGPGRPLTFISGTSMLLRAAALREVGAFDELFFLYWEDTDLCARLVEGGWSLAVAEGSKVRHAMSTTTGRDPLGRAHHIMRSYVLFLRKHSKAAFLNSVLALALQSLGKLRRADGKALRGTWSGWAAGWKAQV